MENTLKQILQLAQGHALNMTFMLVGNQVTMSCTPSPIVGDKTAQPLAAFRGTFDIDAIDEELVDDFHTVFAGELCTSVQRVGAMKKALLTQENEKAAAKAAKTPTPTPSPAKAAATPLPPVATASLIPAPDDDEEDVVVAATTPLNVEDHPIQGKAVEFEF